MKNELDISTIGARIKLAIICLGKTQKWLSETIGISEDAMVNYIKNRRIPPLKTIIKIAEACYVESGWIANGRVDLDRVNAICAAFNKIPKKLLVSFLLKINVSEIYLNMLFDHNIEPSAEFIKKCQGIAISSGIDKKTLSGLNLFAANEIIQVNAHPLFKPTQPMLEEIIDRIYEDNEAQKMVLNLLKSFKKIKINRP